MNHKVSGVKIAIKNIKRVGNVVLPGNVLILYDVFEFFEFFGFIFSGSLITFYYHRVL